MTWTQLFSFVASIATIAAALAVMVTAWIYHRQLRNMIKTRQLEAILVVLKYIDDIRLRRARYFVYGHADELRNLFDVEYSWENRKLIDKKVREMSGDEKIELHDIDLWLNALNNICFLARQDYTPPEVISDIMKNTILHCYHAFKPYIDHRRRRPDDIGEESMYGKHFEWIALNKCMTEAKRRPLTSEPITETPPETRKPLQD
jgi:hypothetical protein